MWEGTKAKTMRLHMYSQNLYLSKAWELLVQKLVLFYGSVEILVQKLVFLTEVWKFLSKFLVDLKPYFWREKRDAREVVCPPSFGYACSFKHWIKNFYKLTSLEIGFVLKTIIKWYLKWVLFLICLLNFDGKSSSQVCLFHLGTKNFMIGYKSIFIPVNLNL